MAVFTDHSKYLNPPVLYRGQELKFDPWSENFIDTPEENFNPRSTFGSGKTATGKVVGDAVFATDRYEYALLYTIPKIDEFSAGFIGYNINQNVLIISYYAKRSFEDSPADFGYVYTLENTSSFRPVLIKNMAAEWFSTEPVIPSKATKVNGLDDISRKNQVLYLSPNTSWRAWKIFSLKHRKSLNQIYYGIEKGLLISYNQQKNINCVNFKIEIPDNILKRTLSAVSLGKTH